MAYWKPITGILPPQSIRQFNGVYKTDDDGFTLHDGLAQDIDNISSKSFPALSLRPGYTQLGSSLGGRVTGLLKWQEKELHAIANGSWQKWSGSAWTSLLTGLSTTADCSFCNFTANLGSTNLIMTNGVDPVKRYDGTTVQNLANAPVGNYIEQHDNRLYIAIKDSAGKLTHIKYSALSKADDWTTAKDAGEIVDETNNGEEIVGIKSGNQRLTIFKNSSIHELYGTGPNNFRLIRVVEDIGAYSNKGIVNVSGILYFISNRIYQYSGGITPSHEFSKPVQKYIDGINPLYASKCLAGTNGKNIYFAIPYNSSECSVVLEYDTQYQTWYVWDNLIPTQFTRLGAFTDWYSADVNGNVVQMSGATDYGIPIKWRWVSPPYGSGTLNKRISWHNLWLLCDLPAGSTLNVSISRLSSGDSDWYTVKSITPQTSVQSARVIIPMASYALSNFIRIKLDGTGPFRVFELDRQMREMPWK